MSFWSTVRRILVGEDSPAESEAPPAAAAAPPPEPEREPDPGERNGGLPVTISINGSEVSDVVEPRLLLVHYIRQNAALTGTKIGCDTSQCGLCVVLENGVAVKSCTRLAVQANGAEVTTIEGMGSSGDLHPLQEGFWEKHGLQCGYCTPGMIMAASELLKSNPDPTDAEIRHGLEGNMCRCTGYTNIVRAVRAAAEAMRGG